jgi:hypothetical protein
MILGAFHQAYANKRATENAVRTFRTYCGGNAPYFLFSDNGRDFSDIAEHYKCFYEYCDYRIGYDKCYGFNKRGTLAWLERFNRACHTLNTEYVIMMEDDVLIQNTIHIPENIEFYGFDTPGNKLPPEFIQYFTDKYSATFHNDWYGSGGGSIFRAQTFMDNYERISEIFEKEFDYVVENLNVNFGWVDNFMTVFYYMCGKHYTVNSSLTEVTKNPYWDNPYYSIVHQYKHLYET